MSGVWGIILIADTDVRRKLFLVADTDVRSSGIIFDCRYRCPGFGELF